MLDRRYSQIRFKNGKSSSNLFLIEFDDSISIKLLFYCAEKHSFIISLQVVYISVYLKGILSEIKVNDSNDNSVDPRCKIKSPILGPPKSKPIHFRLMPQLSLNCVNMSVSSPLCLGQSRSKVAEASRSETPVLTQMRES